MLNKGLSHSQSKTKIDQTKFCKDNEELVRKVRHMEYHQHSDMHPTKETPFMKPKSINWTPPSGPKVHFDSFVDTAKKQCKFFLSKTILLKSVMSTTTKSVPIMNS